MPLEQAQVERTLQGAIAARVDQQDARRLRPRHLVADGSNIVMDIQLNNLRFHLSPL
jgi:hypothetical protein